MTRGFASAAAAVMLVAALGWAAAATPTAAVRPAPAATKVDEQTVHEVASQLRCVVCQSLSVADSPSETANQMRAIVRERLAAGDSREQVLAYFVEKYGDWILLSPPKSGFTLLVWVVPFVALGIGLVLVAVVVRRWSRPPQGAAASQLDPAVRERIRREMTEMDK
ncbi:MAG: cytochrome c-type biogenesis protein CcmH [Candidatus Rokubacteria bacterium]|nr:cytochrome c-type biogenesis protein CcmH [Candidatus Rokubacteria bacterium]